MHNVLDAESNGSYTGFMIFTDLQGFNLTSKKVLLFLRMLNSLQRLDCSPSLLFLKGSYLSSIWEFPSLLLDSDLNTVISWMKKFCKGLSLGLANCSLMGAEHKLSILCCLAFRLFGVLHSLFLLKSRQKLKVP